MTPPDTTLPCPRCGHDSPAWVDDARLDHRSSAKPGTPYRVWCEAHGTKQVTR